MRTELFLCIYHSLDQLIVYINGVFVLETYRVAQLKLYQLSMGSLYLFYWHQ